jgi:transposase
MENLKGIRKLNRGKRMNYLISNWSFYQLQRFIQYKAERKGIEIVKVSPRYTSQICSKCGNLGSRSKGFFSCSHCGYSLNADLNASLNLASPKLEERQASVTKPYIHSDEHEGSSRATDCEVMDKATNFS